MAYYATTLEYVMAELKRIDHLIWTQVQRARQQRPPEGELRGLVISEGEVDALLARPIGMTGRTAVGKPDTTEEEGAILEQMSAAIAQRKAESDRRGIVLRLNTLPPIFRLTALDIDTILICLAPEIDLRYERLYAYLHDDITRKSPTIDLVLNLVCPTLEDKVAARRRFAPGAPLIDHLLVERFDDPARPHSPMLGTCLKLDTRIAGYLLGADEADARLLPYLDTIAPKARLADILLPADVKNRLFLLTRPALAGKAPLFLFHGPRGAGRLLTAEALCAEKGIGLLVIDGERLLHGDEIAFAKMLRLVLREAALQQSAVYWQGIEALLADDKQALRKILLRALQEQDGLFFLAGETAWEPEDALRERAFMRIHFARPGHAERVKLWEAALRGDPARDPDLDVETVAVRFRFTGGRIRDAAATARNLARRRDPERPRVNMDDLFRACRLHSGQKLATLARKVPLHYTWDDIVLPPDAIAQLREACNHARLRHVVHGEWGFDQKLATGKGLTLLFCGPPGTGKTMAADVIAHELQLDLYKIDLSQVVSKYIGETEKNLDRVFEAALDSNAILFFDEADALFGKRTQVRDAHDRYANIEVSYLLQKMEEYDGVAVLATNLREHMDDAFVRRMHFIVEFPFPDEAARRRIWAVTFPRQAPLAEDVDLDILARNVKLVGGNIKNIAFAAAFLAAGDGRIIAMPHLLQAARREHQKLGQAWSGQS